MSILIKSVLYFCVLGLTFEKVITASVSPEIIERYRADNYNLTELNVELPPYFLRNVQSNFREVERIYRKQHPLANMTPIQLIEKHRYPAETHFVTTKDGYVLELHRMIDRYDDFSATEDRPVVLLQHGLLCSSMDWVLAGPNRGLGFVLADRGYDVWMANSRGNRHSRRHVDKSISPANYWDFSWHEMGYYDLPATIDYMVNHTGTEKIFFIGHSQGSTAFFVMLSEHPEYNDKIKAMFTLAPVAYSSHMYSPVFKFVSRFTGAIEVLAKFLGVYEFEPSTEFFKKFSTFFCSSTSLTQPLCENVVFLVCGFDWNQLDKELLPAILHYLPAGSSVKQLTHFGQIINSGHFRQFDFGFYGNERIYNQSTPPSYNLENVRVPVALHYSSNDWLSDTRDVELLYTKLRNPIGKFRVPYDTFNHMDYMWGLDVKILLYDKIVGLMRRYR